MPLFRLDLRSRLFFVSNGGPAADEKVAKTGFGRRTPGLVWSGEGE